MNMDIVDLREFYASPLGRISKASIGMALSGIWAGHHDERLLGLGYSVPYLERFTGDCERAISFMPAAQGASKWPHGSASSTALVFEEELPLSDASIDNVMMVHLLEHSENPSETLTEMWRILSPNGRIIIVVPNRRGVWARLEHTPFGTGRPYSRGQLLKLLRDTGFTATAWADALHFPPSERRFMRRFSGFLERTGRRFWPVFSGVIIVVATKRVYQGIPVKARQSRRVFVPVLAPQGSPVRDLPQSSRGQADV